MKKIKLFLCVALFGVMSFGAFSVYGHLTMSADEKFLLENIEALTTPEPGGGDDSNRGPYACHTGNVDNTQTHIIPDRYCGNCKMARMVKKTGDGECNLY